MTLKWNAHLTFAASDEDAESRLVPVGSDEVGIAAMKSKMHSRCVKLAGVPGPAAIAIKKRMVDLGGDAAVSSAVYLDETAGPTDVILMGNHNQVRGLGNLLRDGEDELGEFGRDLLVLLDRAGKRVYEVPTPKGVIKLGEGPVLMGVVNCTPDSFYDGGRFYEADRAISRGRELMEQGAAIIDVGGESTRPGSDEVGEEEEIRRVLPVVKALADDGAVVSIDTRKSRVARRALAAGAAIVNDISALSDPDLARAAADGGAALVLMHMQGTPANMQKAPRYDDLFGEIIDYLARAMDRALAAGVKEEAIMTDPGIGFGKTVAHNLELIRDLWRLDSLGRPIVLGPSNKSFIGKVLDAGSEERAPGTAASVVAGVLAGAHVLRLHDVKTHRPYAEMAWAIKQGKGREER